MYLPPPSLPPCVGCWIDGEGRGREGGGREAGYGGTMWVELLITSQVLRHHFCSFLRERYASFSCFYRGKCHYYILLTFHDALGYEGTVSDTLWQSFIMIRVFLTKLFQKKNVKLSETLNALVYMYVYVRLSTGSFYVLSDDITLSNGPELKVQLSGCWLYY